MLINVNKIIPAKNVAIPATKNESMIPGPAQFAKTSVVKTYTPAPSVDETPK